MNNTAASSGNSKYLIAYFMLAFIISWSIGIPLALAHQELIPPIFPQWTHYLIPFGPMLSALILTLITQGLSGLKQLGRRMFMLKVCPKWWFISFSPFIIGYVIILILNRLTGSGNHLSDLGSLNFLPQLGLWALPLWIFTFGLGEETGWRGFALPRLQKSRSALGAAMILAALWVLWYLPQFFYLTNPFILVGLVIGLFASSVILTWLYNSASESVFMVSIWHGCFTFMTASKADVGILQAVLTAIIIVIAALVIIRTKPEHLISL